LRASSSWI